MYEARNLVDAGGLLSLGPDLRETYRRAAGYVGRILKGAKPGELPIGHPDRLELVVNVKTADASGMPVPHSLLLRANEVLR